MDPLESVEYVLGGEKKKKKFLKSSVKQTGHNQT